MTMIRLQPSPHLDSIPEVFEFALDASTTLVLIPISYQPATIESNTTDNSIRNLDKNKGDTAGVMANPYIRRVEGEPNRPIPVTGIKIPDNEIYNMSDCIGANTVQDTRVLMLKAL